MLSLFGGVPVVHRQESMLNMSLLPPSCEDDIRRAVVNDPGECQGRAPVVGTAVIERIPVVRGRDKRILFGIAIDLEEARVHARDRAILKAVKRQAGTRLGTRPRGNFRR